SRNHASRGRKGRRPMTKQSLAFSTLFLLAVAGGCTAPLYVPHAVAHVPDQADATPARVSSDGLPLYIPVANLSGKIMSIGESTTTNLVARAATEFRRIYPDVTLQATAGLTSIGPPALLEGRKNIVPMSRPLTPDEIGAFAKKYGYPPTEIKVAA